jgi:hypothetical protein
MPLHEDEKPHSAQIYDLNMTGDTPSFGKRVSAPLDRGAMYSVDEEDHRQAETIRNAAMSEQVAPATPFSPVTPVSAESEQTMTPLPPEAIHYPDTPTDQGIRDIHDLPDSFDSYDVDDMDMELPLNRGHDYPLSGNRASSYRTMPLVGEEKDPYTNVEDVPQATSLAEQHASAYAPVVEGLDTSEHVIQDVSPEMLDVEVEDLGDAAGDIQPAYTSPPIFFHGEGDQWSEQPSFVDGQPDEDSPPRRPQPSARVSRQNRSGSGRNYGAASARPDITNFDALPPIAPDIADKSTVVMSPQEVQQARREQERPSPAASSSITRRPSRRLTGSTGSPASTNAESDRGVSQARRVDAIPLGVPVEQEMSPRAPRAVPSRAGSSPQPQRQGQQRPVARATAGGTATAKPTRKLAESRRSRGIGYLLPILVAVVIVGLIALFGPTADVTVALPAKDYSSAVTLKAGTGTGVQPSERFSNDFYATAVGKATGTTNVGLAPATGIVTFTNTGNVDVRIPTGVVVSTSSGINFTTQAEGVATKAGTSTNTLDVPVQAQSTGKNGNVDAGTITVLPTSSLNTISQASNASATSIKLTLVNAAATTGGGTGTAPAATQQDINTTRAALAKTLSTQYNTWFSQHVGSADLGGTLLQTESLVTAPTPNTALASDGTFTERLHLSATILVIRAAIVQQATATQMNQALRQDKTRAGYTMVTDTQHPIQVQKLQTKTSGNTITFAFNGVGKIVPDISVQQVQHLIAGKSANNARTLLKNNLPNVQNVTITTGPHIGSWTPGIVPLWTGHINVHLVSGT